MGLPKEGTFPPCHICTVTPQVPAQSSLLVQQALFCSMTLALSSDGMPSHALSAWPAPLNFKFSSSFTHFRVTSLLTSFWVWIKYPGACAPLPPGSYFYHGIKALSPPCLALLAFLLCLKLEHTSRQGGHAESFTPRAPSHGAWSQQAL